MREIKFRAWNLRYAWGEKISKKMVFFDIVSLDGNLVLGLTAENKSAYGYIEDDTIIMQYTGLKDSHGKEIYEGDIVYLAGYGFYEVEWPFIQLYESSFENDIGEIIGNIYENQELLSGGKH